MLLLALTLVGALAALAPAGAGERYFWPEVKPGTITVDGNLREWTNIGTPITIDCEHFGGGYVGGDFKGVQDCSARMRMAWDPQYL